MIVSFWCKNCRLDQDSEAEEIKTSLAEFFRARCGKCGKKLIRCISEKHLDSYFHESKKVRRERDRLGIDLIQPNNPKFKMYYKKEWDKIEKAKEEHEKNLKRKKSERETYYKKALDGGASPLAVKKMLELEESNG